MKNNFRTVIGDEVMKSGYCLQPGIREYNQAYELQQHISLLRQQMLITDTVIFLEHYPCFTIGRHGGFNHILAGNEVLRDEGISIYETDRGGDITYHGPGQLVCYPIIDLKGYGRDVHRYARNIEEVVIRTLKKFSIDAGRREGYPGVWVGKEKIAAEGITVSRWVTMHGIALNVCPLLKHFSLIVPCGISDFGVTSMEKLLGCQVDINQVRREMQTEFEQVFAIKLEDINLGAIEEMVKCRNLNG